MTILVQLVVGEFEFIKADHLLHPLSSLCWRVRVNMDPWRRVGVSLACHHPAGGVECISVTYNVINVIIKYVR